MRPLPALALALLAPVLVLAACAGDDDEGTASLIHRLLLAAGTDAEGALESFPGRLPDDLPIEPPLYPGARLVVSSRQPAPTSPTEEGTAGAIPRPLLYFIVLDSSDSRAEVFDFYEVALDTDPWQIESSFSTRQLDTIEFVDVEDPDIAGAVSIAEGGEDGRTSILISLQDAGAFVDEDPLFRLGQSLAVPKDFPGEIAVYEDATVIGSAFFREPGSSSFLLILLTTDSQDEVIDFYTQEFEGLGWSVDEGATVGLEDRIEFRDAEGDVQGELTADRFATAPRYTEVRLRLLINPARAPAGTPTPGETPDATPEPTDASDGGGPA
jgi:predicted enzyme related to lactoylglutathione lyase